MTLTIPVVVDVALVLGASLVVTTLLKSQSAAFRHRVLACAVVAALAVPILEWSLPQWPLPLAGAWTTPEYATSGLRMTANPVDSGPPTETSTALPIGGGQHWLQTLVIILWAAGAIVSAAALATGFMRLHRLVSRGVDLESGPWADAAHDLAPGAGLSTSPVVTRISAAGLLVTWGKRRPRIVVPADAADWPIERIRMVTAHELAHIGRNDWLFQIGAEIVRCIYWFNPLAWVVCRELRHESEYACDDAVLDQGVGPTAYASHLLEVARQFSGAQPSWAAASAIARPSTLERRISAMFNNNRNRRPMTLRASLTAALLISGIAIPVSALDTAGTDTTTRSRAVPVNVPADAASRDAIVFPPAPSMGERAGTTLMQQGAAFSGVLYDQLGGLLPGVGIQFTDVTTGAEYTATTGRDGAFAFNNLTAGKYKMVATLPGFATVTNGISLQAGEQLRRSVTLPLGLLQETIFVRCTGAPTAAVTSSSYQAGSGRGVARASGAAARPFSGGIGGQIKAPHKLGDARPVCPSNLALTNSAVVKLAGRVGIDGYMNDVHLVSSDTAGVASEPEYIQSAVDAVQQWVFTPTLLNDVPVEANIDITVQFSR